MGPECDMTNSVASWCNVGPDTWAIEVFDANDLAADMSPYVIVDSSELIVKLRQQTEVM